MQIVVQTFLSILLAIFGASFTVVMTCYAIESVQELRKKLGKNGQANPSSQERR